MSDTEHLDDEKEMSNKVGEYLSKLGGKTKLAFARRDETVLRYFREDALRVLTMDEWNQVLAKCDKYAKDTQRRKS